MKTLLRSGLMVMLLLLASCDSESRFVASSQREPFHRPSCEWARKINEANLVKFSTRDAALKAGHRPCKVCRP